MPSWGDRGDSIEQEAELVLVVPDRLMVYLRHLSPAELQTIGMGAAFPYDCHLPNSENDQGLSNQASLDHLYQTASIPGSLLYSDH